MRTIVAAALALLVAAPAIADTTEGLILAFDRKDGVIIMADKTVWPMPDGLVIPFDLGAGDRILIDFTSDGDNGVVSIDEITRLATAIPQGVESGG